MSLLRAASDKAETVLHLNRGLLLICLVVIAIIGSLILVGLARQRRSVFIPDGPELVAATRPPGAIIWIYVGIALTALTLLGSLIWSMLVLARVAAPSGPPGLTVEVTGHQWWWEINYLDDDLSRRFTTANEMHVPTGVPVRVRLKSADVIHSFWVPALSGKVDLIPGQVNETWIEAREAGPWRGQCAEFCGAQHAHMAFSVIAETPEKFKDWWRFQLENSPPPAGQVAEAGHSAFMRRCASCHTIRGTDAGGKLGPDLSHLVLREALAAETIPNTPGHRTAWVADPQGIKPGNQMPILDLPGPELASIEAYLATLK
jgi:cytochrome c oxidase subunit II